MIDGGADDTRDLGLLSEGMHGDDVPANKRGVEGFEEELVLRQGLVVVQPPLLAQGKGFPGDEGPRKLVVPDDPHLGR